MNRIRSVLIMGASLLSNTLSAQLAINWSSIDAGGGTATGGVYSVSGSIGQPDAGTPMTNGRYSVTGGFALPTVVQTPGAPRLTMSPMALARRRSPGRLIRRVLCCRRR